ncbi:MAG: N-acetyltransferase [Actinomycetota bacterium]|jgi:RimJ/RimL family protein N-acetyltransferase|nr:N-acetyltransferase [Actinomycetota bacterium]
MSSETGEERSFVQAPTLENQLVRLEQLDSTQESDLARVAAEGDLWRTWYTHVPAPKEVEAEIQRRLALQRAGEMAPWGIVDPTTDRVVGMTTYMNIDEENRRLEIGSTWMATTAQGTGINPAAKLLLMTRAFEVLDCIAVEFRTHFHNWQSREAIARLGARQDGILRNHMLWRDGTIRDTVVFSVLDSEWSTVKLGLEERLSKHPKTAGKP